jgi:hypothetical protein
MLNHLFEVMAGLISAIHMFLAGGTQRQTPAGDQRGHDGAQVMPSIEHAFNLRRP